MKKTCKQCGAEFTLSEDEIAFYRGKNLHIPKRCEKCRRENKAKAEGKTAEQVVRPYHGKKDNEIKRWTAAAAVCVLLAVVIGALRAGWVFEGAWPGAAQGGSAEITADMQPEISGELGAVPSGTEQDTAQGKQAEVSGEPGDAPQDTEQDRQAEVSGEPDDAPPDTEQNRQAEVSGEPGDVLQGTEQDTAQGKQAEISGEPGAALSDTPQKTPEDRQTAKTASSGHTYSFRKAEYLQEHFEKHGDEFGYTTADEYLAGANRVVAAPGVLHKLEAEDGDDVYYLESSNEFVIVSTDGYIRTYFKPNDGKAYFDRQ